MKIIFTGSFGGKQEVIVDGDGFSINSEVTIGGLVCEITEVTNSAIKCLTPAMSGNDSTGEFFIFW